MLNELVVRGSGIVMVLAPLALAWLISLKREVIMSAVGRWYDPVADLVAILLPGMMAVGLMLFLHGAGSPVSVTP